jgi:hypothetical protein
VRTWHGTLVAVGAVVAGTALVVACGGDGGTARPRPTTTDAATTTAGEVEDLVVDEDDLVNINTMTPVRGFFVDNLLGHLDEALAIAEANEGGTYPVGTIIQLVPTEVMVKRAPGFSPETKDWEFLFVEVTPEGTRIIDRGTTDVINAFGLDCASCHLLAEDRFDMVCESDHGCDPLPIGRDVIEAVQAADPRPR